MIWLAALACAAWTWLWSRNGGRLWAEERKRVREPPAVPSPSEILRRRLRQACRQRVNTATMGYVTERELEDVMRRRAVDTLCSEPDLDALCAWLRPRFGPELPWHVLRWTCDTVARDAPSGFPITRETVYRTLAVRAAKRLGLEPYLDRFLETFPHLGDAGPDMLLQMRRDLLDTVAEDRQPLTQFAAALKQMHDDPYWWARGAVKFADARLQRAFEAGVAALDPNTALDPRAADAARGAAASAAMAAVPEILEAWKKRV